MGHEVLPWGMRHTHGTFKLNPLFNLKQLLKLAKLLKSYNVVVFFVVNIIHVVLSYQIMLYKLFN